MVLVGPSVVLENARRKEDVVSEQRSCHSRGKQCGSLNGHGKRKVWACPCDTKTTSLGNTLPVGWQGSNSEDKRTSKVHGILVYFSWSPFAAEWGGLQAEKASALHPAAAAKAVHPPGTDAFLLFCLSSGWGRRAGGQIAAIAGAKLQPVELGTAMEWDEMLGAHPDVPHSLYDRKLNSCPSIGRVSVWWKHQVTAAPSPWSAVNYSQDPNSSNMGRKGTSV